jgi:putative transcriptional regulator
VKITHHLDDATIIAYAAGTLGEAHGFAVATHLAFCESCRRSVRQAEALGGEILLDEKSAAVSDACRAATFASLEAMGKTSVRNTPVHQQGELPPVLRSLISGQKLADLPWRKKAPGVATIELPLSAGAKTHLQLLRIGPGREMPEHGHGGEELTVILQGSYSDHTGRYSAGDVADLDTDIEHQPKVDSEVDCICLIATEAPTRFKSFWAKVAQPLIGI